MKTPELYYRVLQTDGDVLKKLTNYYDGIVIEAHILEHYTNFTTSLVSAIKKPFFIDPTHKLALFNLECIAEKEWVIKIMEVYKISEYLQEKEIDLELLREHLNTFVKATIKYQRARLSESSGGLKLFGIVPESQELKPQIILAPYFLIDGINTESYKLNLEIIEKAIPLKDKDKLYAVLALEGHLLSKDPSKIISDFAKEGVDGFCVWISDFREYDEDPKMLKKYVEFFEELSKVGKPVINLYGGAFSVFIGKLGFIDCIVQGIGYGEYRNPFVHATGGYPKRYYIPKIHRFVPIHLAQELLAAVPELKCECDFCLEANILETQEEMINASSLKKHYVLSRWREKQTDFNDLYRNLTNTIQLLDEHGVLDKYWYHLRHLKNWCEVLESFSSERP
ncbi:MAG: hypothetical protein DSY33_04010 [Archaeoglobus sp.]|nr:MAG: hypothetical protein DSY33_04010 [Archaeoglobus sp.]